MTCCGPSTPSPRTWPRAFDDDGIIDNGMRTATPPIRGPSSAPECRQVDAINCSAGEERVDQRQAGTTRDSISVETNWKGRDFRRVRYRGPAARSRIEEKLEKLSVADALRAVRFAEVAALMMDTQNKLRGTGPAYRRPDRARGPGAVIAVNKWDLMELKPGSFSALRTEADHWLPQVRARRSSRRPG